MTLEQARAKVSQLAAAQWRMVDPTSAFGRQFVSGMVPFVPLSDAELRKVLHIEIGKLTPRIERFLAFQASNSSIAYQWAGRVRWNEKRLDPTVLGLLGQDLRDYNARAIRNLVERHLLVHATAVARCLVAHSVATAHAGWLWGRTVHLLDDVKVGDVDSAGSFTVAVGDASCVAPAARARPASPAGGEL
jgi:hypothetical protein